MDPVPASAARPHWAGWGQPGSHPLSAEALRALGRRLGGPLPATPAVGSGEVRVGPSRLDPEDLAALAEVVGAEHVEVGDWARLVHAGGKSYVDLIRRRRGDADNAPDAVVSPAGHDEVQRLLVTCDRLDLAVVPFGGGTSVVGGVEPDAGEHRAVVTLDLSRLARLVDVDRRSRLATVEAGMRGPDLEQALATHGLTLGHVPQSFEFATVGGYAATRSAGQASTGVGRFDQLVEALRLATPVGELRAGRPPASAAGPDLRDLVLGSEGTLGVITELTLRVRPRPAETRYLAWAMPSFAAGQEVLRDLAAEDAGPDVVRLSDESETEIALLTAGVRGAKALALGAYLRARRAVTPCLLVLGFEGTRRSVDSRHRDAVRALRRGHAVALGSGPGKRWHAGRFAGPYQRDALLDHGVLVETLETAGTWTGLTRLYDGVRTALRDSLADAGSAPVIMCHMSHVYATGASLYFTVLARARRGEEAEQWRAAKRAASEAISRSPATITHHHAVGIDHAPWLPAEVGPLGIDVLQAVKARLDPHGILNPGKLIAPIAPGAAR